GAALPPAGAVAAGGLAGVLASGGASGAVAEPPPGHVVAWLPVYLPADAVGRAPASPVPLGAAPSEE
ncbi:MAG TPA: hypothetical protein VHQ65_02915, partial [Thermoanaerobaculia bacterium]|nr:hypothetical protein [Thermoanaerobaculia bacterium]